VAYILSRNLCQKSILGVLFLIPEEKFHVGSQLELQLEFRTSENTGVLLSVSEPDGYPALSLEINDGKVSSRNWNTFHLLKHSI
jgi:hypothetical protein